MRFPKGALARNQPEESIEQPFARLGSAFTMPAVGLTVLIGTFEQWIHL